MFLIKRRVGRPSTTYLKSYEGEIRQCGHSWGKTENAAQNRVRLRTVAEALPYTRKPKCDF